MTVNQLTQNEERDAFVLGIHLSCHKSLYLYAVGRCKRFGYDSSYADDILQEVYQKLLYKYPKTAEGYHKHGARYLFGMVRKEMLSMNRKEKSLQRIHKVLGERAPREASPLIPIPKRNLLSGPSVPWKNCSQKKTSQSSNCISMAIPRRKQQSYWQ